MTLETNEAGTNAGSGVHARGPGSSSSLGAKPQPLTSDDARRISASAALLSSNSDGERLSAANAVCRLLGRHGLDPARVVAAGLETMLRPPAARIWSVPISQPHQRLAGLALKMSHLLTEWESSFLRSIVELRELTPKQKARFEEISAKLDRKVAA